MYAYFNDNLPSYYTNYFKIIKNIHCHNTRSASNIYIDYKRTNYGKFSLKIRGAQIWNKLSKDLKILKSYSLFKKSNKSLCAKSDVFLGYNIIIIISS